MHAPGRRQRAARGVAWTAATLSKSVRKRGKAVCPPLLVRRLVLDCASEGCSDDPSRSSSQEDEPWQIIGKDLSESMSRS